MHLHRGLFRLPQAIGVVRHLRFSPQKVMEIPFEALKVSKAQPRGLRDLLCHVPRTPRDTLQTRAQRHGHAYKLDLTCHALVPHAMALCAPC